MKYNLLSDGRLKHQMRREPPPIYVPVMGGIQAVILLIPAVIVIIQSVIHVT